MIKYLFVLFTLTTLFSAQGPILPSETDLEIVRRITGYPLNNREFDKSFEQPGLSPYKFDGGNVIFYACEGRPYNSKNLSGTMKVTERFFARAATKTEVGADKKDTKIKGLNFLVSTGKMYNLIVYSKSCIPWSELSKLSKSAIISLPQMDQWSIAAYEPAGFELPLEVREFCNIEFRGQF